MIKSIPQYQGLEITFNTTEDCNLQCAYCYEKTKKPGDLPLEYAQKFIDLILDDPDPLGVIGTDKEWINKQGLILDFIGGDALMRPKLVESILRYFIFTSIMKGHRWGRRWRASISTNGTLFTDEVKAFLTEFNKNISLGVSVDGCPEIHNKNRSNSIDKILKDWDWYLNYNGQEFATTKATLNRDSIPWLSKSVKFLHEDLRLNQISMNFIFEEMGETEEDLKVLDKELEKTVDYVLQHKNDLFLSLLDSGFSCGSPMKDPNTGWCGSGMMPALSISGKIYPCFRFLPHTMHSRELDFHVGDIWNGFDHKERFAEVRDQTRVKISTKECLECPIETACAWCIGGAYSESGKFYRQTNICKVHKLQDKWANVYWNEYKKNQVSKET